jgi:hypothetical protein
MKATFASVAWEKKGKVTLPIEGLSRAGGASCPQRMAERPIASIAHRTFDTPLNLHLRDLD